MLIRMMKLSGMRWTGHVARMVEGRSDSQVFVGIREGRRPLGRPRSKWEENTKVDF
jgi:hypothetical protein